MDRCGGANIKVGDKYSIRFTDRVHWFLEIQSKKKNGNPCIFTIGLGLLEDKDAPEIFKEVPGPDMFKGFAFIFSPDKVELECHRRLFNDPNAPQPPKSPFDLPFDHRCRNLKYIPPYPKAMMEYYSKNQPGFFDKKKAYLRGKPVRSIQSWFDPKIRKYSGRINETQLKVIQHFVAKKRYKTFLGMKYKRIILPSPYFLLSQYDPGVLNFLEKRGILKKKWWNCRKFVNMFHRQPFLLLQFLQKVGVKRRSSMRRTSFKKTRKSYGRKRN